jgi:hypothetical protein
MRGTDGAAFALSRGAGALLAREKRDFGCRRDSALQAALYETRDRAAERYAARGKGV